MVKSNNNVKRLAESLRKLQKSERRLKRARAERIWIEENPQINLLNYPFYKLSRSLSLKFGNPWTWPTKALLWLVRPFIR